MTGLLMAATPDFIGQIETAVNQGDITQEEAILVKFYYGFDQDKLPVQFKPESFHPLKNGTEIIWEYEALRSSLSPGTVEIIDDYNRTFF